MQADSAHQRMFAEEMNKLMYSNFKFTFPISLVTTGNYKICVHPDKSNEILEKPVKGKTDSLFLICFSRQTRTIDSTLMKLQLPPKKVILGVDSGYNVLYEHHKYRAGMNDMVTKNLSQFLTDTISKSLDPYRKEIEVSTIYRYLFTYESESSWEIWIKNKTSFKNHENNLVIENKKLISGFNAKIPNAKNGRYKVRINSSKLNDSVFGPNIDVATRKFKFMTHAGLSVGTFFNGKKISSDADAADGSLIYWNLFVIYHRFGIFGGFSSKGIIPKTILNNYFEAGGYVAPVNYLYFKLGLAVHNNKTSGLAGVSLIFPGFQVESGYNFAINSVYAMLGFNIPFNK
jgi:hypothetical protein